ncbi:response regulator transcription factor [Geobacter pelophilus]|uniref:Response regulator transcription factor n=1 Tax=Geoanaerobacter pelophilus TaxID=60036 RepID=A0AAW4L483_9BACT|nr:response regulator transcription factor [Geoanaerobacter pelophilus]MBT0664620.1 response regulator transcription factor [Geoanaerobacter pelophilus]
MRIKILLVDDHAIFREGLRSLIEKEADMTVVGEAGNGIEAIRLARELSPDVVIMDISMPEMNGIEATKQIREARGDVKVLALSMESDRRFIVEVLDSGANGYILKDAPFSELADAVRIVADNETYLGPRITELIIKDYLQRIPDRLPLTFESLTNREREIIQLIADGKSTKDIASQFVVSIKTIEVHRHAIMKKLNLYSVAELTKYAIREGLTSLN